MHTPAMSILGDSTIVHSHYHQQNVSDVQPASPDPATSRRSLRKSISIPAAAALVKESWNWAGDTLHTYRDGLSKEQRKQQAEIEDRKQVLYLRMKNVSGPIQRSPCP